MYRELYQELLTDRTQARMILDMTLPSENITFTFADPSLWTRKNVNNVVTCTADEYKAVGVRLTPGDNDRLSGKRKVDRLLGNLPDGSPGLVFFSTCINTIRTIPELPFDTVKVEDVDTDAEDHAYDTIRYGLTNHRMPAPPEQVRAKVTESPIQTLGNLL